MKMIEFSNAFDVIEMFETRFAFANVDMQTFTRDSIETYISQIDDLKFDFDELHELIEFTLQMQIAFEFVRATFNDNDESLFFVVQIVARDIEQNESMFDVINVESMRTIDRIIVDAKLNIFRA